MIEKSKQVLLANENLNAFKLSIICLVNVEFTGRTCVYTILQNHTSSHAKIQNLRHDQWSLKKKHLIIAYLLCRIQEILVCLFWNKQFTNNELHNSYITCNSVKSCRLWLSRGHGNPNFVSLITWPITFNTFGSHSSIIKTARCSEYLSNGANA